MDFLIWSIGNSVLELVQFTDKKVEDRTMKTNRLIVPGQRRIRKWFTSLLNVHSLNIPLTPPKVAALASLLALPLELQKIPNIFPQQMLGSGRAISLEEPAEHWAALGRLSDSGLLVLP